MSHYPHLFAPIRVRNVYIKNRIESAPMSASGDVPFYTREAYEMYDTIARGGAGIVRLGEAGVHSLTDHAHPTMPHLDDENLLPTLIQTVDTVHKWGALASIELTHSGCRAGRLCHRTQPNGGESLRRQSHRNGRGHDEHDSRCLCAGCLHGRICRL